MNFLKGKKHMSQNCAAPSLFGWDFQVNAAIAILIDNIKDVDKVRLEGAKQDIEITLSNKEKIYAQAKAVEKAGDYSNVKKHLANALNSLNNTALDKDGSIKQFIYITNSENPMGNMQTMSQFIGPYIRQPYVQLTDKAKEIIENALTKAEKTVCIDRNKLFVHVLQFQNGASPADRYTNIKRIVDEFVETILENRNGIGGKVLDVWQKELLLNGSVSNTCITLNKKQFTWIIVVKALENSLQDNSFYDKFDVSEVQQVQNHFNTFICNSVVRFEFVTAVLSDFNDFVPKERNKKTIEFIEEKWSDYTTEFALDKMDLNTQEILVKTILARIIYQSSTINSMKEKNLI